MNFERALSRLCRSWQTLLLDEHGIVLKYGTTNDPLVRYGKYLRGEIERSTEFSHLISKMEVIASDLSEAEARALETDLVKEAKATGQAIYNQVSETGEQWVGKIWWDPHTPIPSTHEPIEIPRPVSRKDSYTK